MDMCGWIVIELNMNIDIFCQLIEKRVKVQIILNLRFFLWCGGGWLIFYLMNFFIVGEGGLLR